MNNIVKLGWDPSTLGEIDHTKVKAPYVRLSHYTVGVNGDVVYVYDLRIFQPNVAYLRPNVLHSLEHLFLAGFKKQLKDNFINIAPMGCQTGFYLVTLNEGMAENIYMVYEKILIEIVSSTVVPYLTISQCGQFTYHDLTNSINVAEWLLANNRKLRTVF